MYPGIFSARTDRIGFLLGYIYSFLPVLVVILLYALISYAFQDFVVNGGVLASLINVVLFIFGLVWLAFYPIVTISIYIRRLHDLGHSGWFVLLSFVPIVGSGVFLFLLLFPGDKDDNKYGVPLSPRSFDTVLFGPHPAANPNAISVPGAVSQQPGSGGAQS